MVASQKKELYYGWKMVWAILIILTFTSGLSFYNHTVILNGLAAQRVFTVEVASFAVSLFFLSTGFSGLAVAKWIDIADPRYCIMTGALVAGGSLFALGHVATIPQLYLTYIVFGAGFSASSLIPATTLVTRWFVRKRAMALSVASTGLSLGGVVITPVSALMFEAFDMSTTLAILAAVYIVGVIPITWLWLRPDPASMGLGPQDSDYLQKQRLTTNAAQDNDAFEQPGSTEEVVDMVDGVSFKEARGQRFFWGLSIAYVFLMLAQVGGISHQYGLARETLTESQTALALAILPIASIVGRLIGGWLADRIAIRGFALSMMVLQVVALCLLALGGTPLTLCVGLVLFGLTVGNLLMLQPLIISEAFGLKEYARIYSVSNLMTSWGTASGPAILGLAYAANQQQYSWSYLAAGFAGLLGLLFFLAGGKMRRHSG